jgi:hypothetical protein
MLEAEEHVPGLDSSGRKESFQYVPLKKLLKFQLSHSELTDNIARQRENWNCVSDLLRDFSDGTVYKNHPVLSNKPNCIPLYFYNDEFEVVNPLGSKKLKHKCILFFH